MRLISASINNYRVHCHGTPCKVDCHPELHVIHGPNEVGKSTLVEAIWAALFIRAKGTSAFHRGMRPHSGAKPEVEVVFEDGSHHYTVRKQFKGQGATCELIVKKGDEFVEQLSGDAAESRLRDVLQLPDQGTGKRKDHEMAQWRLLWVDQGRSVLRPEDDLNSEAREDLENILAAETGAALVTSTESDLLSDLDDQVKSIFTDRNKQYRSGSPPHQANHDYESICEKHDAASQRLRELENLSEAYVRADRELTELRERMPALAVELDQCQLKHDTAAELAGRLEKIETEIKLAVNLFEQDKKAQESLVKLQASIESHKSKIKEQKKHRNTSEKELKEVEDGHIKLVVARDQTEEAYRLACRLTQRLAAHLVLLRLTRETDPLTQRLKQIEEAEQALEEIDTQLARHPVDKKKIKSLRKLEEKRANEKIALEAAAVKIELTTSSPASVKIDGRAKPSKLAADKQHDLILDRPSLLRIGDGLAELKVLPGGEDLADRRERLHVAEGKLQAALDKIGISSMADAEVSATARDKLEREREKHESTINALAPEGREAIEKSLRELRQQRAETTSERDRQSVDGDAELPGELDETQAAFKQQQGDQRKAERARDDARNQLAELDQRIQRLREKVALADKEMTTLNQAQKDEQARLKDVIKTYGSEDKLAGAVRDRQADVDKLKEQAGAMHKEREAMQPEFVEAELERLSKAKTSAEKDERDKSEELVSLRAQLHAEDAIGLHERLGDLNAQKEAASDALRRATSRANALRLLRDTLRTCQEQTTQRVMAPLRAKVEPLLKLVFGEIQAGFEVEDQSGRLTLRPLVRNDVADEFDALSMGAREQVGVCVRLALAQILAERHGGRLPVVLDEPFVHTDPDRLRRILGILNLVKRDLQVIVLTCDFSGYRELGLSSDQVTELEPHA